MFSTIRDHFRYYIFAAKAVFVWWLVKGVHRFGFVVLDGHKAEVDIAQPLERVANAVSKSGHLHNLELNREGDSYRVVQRIKQGVSRASYGWYGAHVGSIEKVVHTLGRREAEARLNTTPAKQVA